MIMRMNWFRDDRPWVEFLIPAYHLTMITISGRWRSLHNSNEFLKVKKYMTECASKNSIFKEVRGEVH